MIIRISQYYDDLKRMFLVDPYMTVEVLEPYAHFHYSVTLDMTDDESDVFAVSGKIAVNESEFQNRLIDEFHRSLVFELREKVKRSIN